MSYSLHSHELTLYLASTVPLDQNKIECFPAWFTIHILWLYQTPLNYSLYDSFQKKLRSNKSKGCLLRSLSGNEWPLVKHGDDPHWVPGSGPELCDVEAWSPQGGKAEVPVAVLPAPAWEGVLAVQDFESQGRTPFHIESNSQHLRLSRDAPALAAT